MCSRRMPVLRVVAAVVAWAIALAACSSQSLQAQVRLRVIPFPGRPGQPTADRQARMVHITNRRLAQRLLKARELLKQKQVQPAIRLLQSLIEHEEDVFFREPAADGSDNPQAPYRSLKLAAAELLGTIGAQGRSAYELEYGTIARKLLETARQKGGSELLEEVARKYLHSVAGRQAAYALGNRCLDQGQTLMAAMRYEQLRKLGATEFEPLLSMRAALAWARIGQPTRAAQILLEMPEGDRGKLIARGGPLADVLSNQSQVAMVRSLVELSERPPGDGGRLSRDWITWRGRHDRSATADPAVPAARPKWSFPTFERELDDPKRQDRLAEVLGELGQLETSERARDGLLLPAVDPLVIGDVVVFRSLFDIKAVHLDTGRLLWDSITVDPAFERILDGRVPSYSVAGRTMRQSLTELYLGQRAWYDRTIGSLSSDGRQVYAIDWVGVLGLQVFTPRGLSRQPDTAAPWVPRQHNSLLAFDLASEGMLAWELGGPAGDRESELDGTFFLGPPLPLGGRLYCLGERDGEIRLLAIHPDGPHRTDQQNATALEWSQGIAQPEFSILTHPGRRLAGLSPSYSDGVLVCPTEAGLVVGIDVARRQLLWSYSYTATNSQLSYSAQRAMRRMLMSNRIAQLSRNDGWFDSVPLLSNGSVILTPRDSDQLHCLDLETGRLRWSRSRGQAHFVAAVYQDKVVLVERGRVQAYSMKDGHAAWSMPTSIPRPTGVGVRVGTLYHLPVESRGPSGATAQTAARRGAIITIDLQTGRLMARTELADGRLVGHLVGAGGRLLGLSHNELVAFENDQALQDRIAARLSRDKMDATALALRGRRRLHRGEYEPAVADLAASFEARKDPDVRRLLVQALLDGLRSDYSRYADQATRLEKLLASDDEQLAFRRLRAAGLSRTGKVVEAFDEYLKLCHSADQKTTSTPQPPPPPQPPQPPKLPNSAGSAQRGQLETINEDLGVRRTYWVASQLIGVDRRATASQKTVLAARRKTLFDEAVAMEVAPSTVALQQFVTLFDGHPIADRARVKLLERFARNTPAVQRERLLLALRAAVDPAVAGRATSELAALWSAQQKPAAIAVLRDELESGRFAGVELAPGRTGQATVAAWRKDPSLKTLVETLPEWKTGSVTATSSANGDGRTNASSQPIPFVGHRPLAWRGWTFRLDSRRQYVIGYDDRGRERWRLTTVGDLAVPGSNAKVPYAFEGNQVQASGHLLMVVLGNRFAVVDGLGDQQHPHVLWCRNLYEGKSGVQSRIARLPGVIGPGPRWFKMTDATGRPLGHVGRLGPRRLTYQVGTAIEAADPLTGRVLWRRSGVPRGCRVYGTDRYVCVEPDQRNEVLVLDAADGTAVATRSLPASDELISRLGVCVVSRRTNEKTQTVSAFNLVTGKRTFSIELAGDIRPVITGSHGVGLLEPGGRFRVVDVSDGQVRVDAKIKLPQKPTAQSFVVLETQQLYLLMVNQPSTTRVRATSSRGAIVNGSAWAFDRNAGPGRRGGPSEQPVAQANWGPVKIENQAIELDQPRHLPLLTFASRVYRPVQNIRQQRPRTEYGVLVLDVRNGKIVHSETSKSQYGHMRVVSSRVNQRVTLEFYRSTIALDFSD